MLVAKPWVFCLFSWFDLAFKKNNEVIWGLATLIVGNEKKGKKKKRRRINLNKNNTEYFIIIQFEIIVSVWFS